MSSNNRKRSYATMKHGSTYSYGETGPEASQLTQLHFEIAKMIRYEGPMPVEKVKALIEERMGKSATYNLTRALAHPIFSKEPDGIHLNSDYRQVWEDCR